MPQWTHDQQAAISNRGGTLLVSAAAGSGKTAVLVERVLQQLTDPVDPVSIDRLLLVTFTNAAAAEMRERIGAALRDAVANDPSNTRLRRQLFLVHQAQIMTVHAMCLQLVREQAATLGIAPDFRLMDEQESTLLRRETLEILLEEAYEEADPGFLSLCDLLSAGRDDAKLGEVILGTYEKIQAHPDPRAFLEQVRRGLYAADMNTPHGRVLLEQARTAAEYGATFLRNAIALTVGVDVLEDAYLPALTSDLNQANRLLDVLRQGDWDTCVQAAQAIHFDRLKSASKCEDKERMAELKAMRAEWKDIAGVIRDRWLTEPVQEAVADRVFTTPVLAALIAIVNRFDTAFAAAKRARNAADFSDLEHFAVKLLYQEHSDRAVTPDASHVPDTPNNSNNPNHPDPPNDPENQPSALAKTLSENYTEIAVDEYQDTNAVQDAIFRALSRQETNLFLVGDVKQSIYGFRLADPSIFLKKYRAFADYEQAQPGQPRRVILGQNFRSRRAVLDACNYLFTAVMGDTVGGLRYTDAEALHLGATYPDEGHPRYNTEVMLIDAEGLSQEEDSPDKTRLEAQFVAMRIRTLLTERFLVTDKETGALRPVTPDDIVILLRSTKAKARVYLSVLKEAGIAASADERGALLETAEVSAIVSLLFVIDNPRQDVDLIGTLRSPMFGFTEQELAEIRLMDEEASYYDALRKAGETMPKVADFLKKLDALREFAYDQPVHRLLWEIYDKTGVLGLYGALPNGAQRQSNLLAFFERARAFEDQEYHGLFAFVRLLAGMKETQSDFQTAGTEALEGAVRVMSIHRSKGLEFPVVIVADCGKRFNEMDLQDPILIHSQLGFGSKCKDTKRGIQYDSVERTAVTVQQRKEMVSEELRVLYVAMTRAKEKLILTCSSSGMSRLLQKAARLAALDELPQYAMGAVRSFASWILTPLLRHPCTRALRQEYGLSVPEQPTTCDSFTVSLYHTEDLHLSQTVSAPLSEVATQETVVVQPSLPYPHAYLAQIPSKLTATGIRRGYRAREAAEHTTPARPAVALRAPFFEQQTRQLTAAEIGIAHHFFMQFCDFQTACQPGGVATEIKRLADRNILSAEQAAVIDQTKIETFFASSLYRNVIASNPIQREFKFSVLIPAKNYFPEAAETPDENVLLQGVIDCLVTLPKGFVIVDFKTGRVTRSWLPARAETYRAQMDAYVLAIEQIFHRPVYEQLLYFFEAGQTYSLVNGLDSPLL